MRTWGWWLLVVLAGCASRELSGLGEGEPEDDWSPEDDADIGPVYLLVTEERADDQPSNEPTSANVRVIDVSQPGGEGEQATVLKTLVNIDYPVLSPSRRWAAIGTGLLNSEELYDVFLIDFVGSPLEPARSIERPAEQGYFYGPWFAADDSGLATWFRPIWGDDRNYLYYVPLLESGPLVPLEIEMPDDRLASTRVGLSDDGRWVVFVADDGEDAGIYVSEIVGGEPSPAVLAHDTSLPFTLGDELHVAGGAVIFETYEPVGAEDEQLSLHRLHRVDLDTLELRTLTPGEPEPERWHASNDGSDVLYVYETADGQVADYIAIVEGEPQPPVPLGLGDDEAVAVWAGFLAIDGRYAVAKVFSSESDSYSFAWYDFEGPNATEPAGVEAVGGYAEHGATWAASVKPEGSVLLVNPSLGVADVVELPPPWHANHLSVYDESTRVVIQAIEGAPSDPSDPGGESPDGVWTLRATDEHGPPRRFDHPLEPDQHLPLHFNVRHIPSSERHFYQVINGDIIDSVFDIEQRTIWENDGLDGRTALVELEGVSFAHIVVAPQWQATVTP